MLLINHGITFQPLYDECLSHLNNKTEDNFLCTSLWVQMSFVTVFFLLVVMSVSVIFAVSLL